MEPSAESKDTPPVVYSCPGCGIVYDDPSAVCTGTAEAGHAAMNVEARERTEEELLAAGDDAAPRDPAAPEEAAESSAAAAVADNAAPASDGAAAVRGRWKVDDAGAVAEALELLDQAVKERDAVAVAQNLPRSDWHTAADAVLARLRDHGDGVAG